MNEKIGFNTLRNAVKTSREIKKESRRKNVNIEGISGENVEQIEEQVQEEFLKLLSENKDWVDRQKKKVAEIFPDCNEQEVLSVFQEGLFRFFKQQYRLATEGLHRRKKEIPPNLKDAAYIQEQIAAFTFDFIYSLKASKKAGVTPAQALELTKLLYFHNPNVLKELSRKYPTAGSGIIHRAALDHPQHPDDFIRDNLGKVDALRAKYPRDKYPTVGKRVINYAALLNDSLKSEKFIEDYVRKVEELSQKYPNIVREVINYAALNFPDSDKFIEKYPANTQRLISLYPNASLKTIRRALLLHPSDPEGFIKQHQSDKIIESGAVGDDEEE